MSFNLTPYKPRPPPGQQGSTPFRSSSINKFRSSLVPSSRPSPARSPKSPAKFTKTTTGARNLFDTTPRSQRTTQFAPDLPEEVTRLNPRMRKTARRSVSTGMSNTTSSQPFQLRIPSPDPGLTGEALAKEVPDDPNRTESIYADQFLAHKCPPHFDELQRRQFFCILDLRRLKYTADEIFAKKDWKLNILNFAKEFEKSRSLIMLRYGLYEFKSVKPSTQVLQKWRTAHGILPEPESSVSGLSSRRTSGPTGSTKRKAEGELTPKDDVNKNKRRNIIQQADNTVLSGNSPVKTTKRKAEVSEKEGKTPNKVAKSTPSKATSIFESILNKSQNATSASKSVTQPSHFGVSKLKDSQNASSASKANPFQPSTGSLLFGSAKTIDSPSTSSRPPESVLSSHKVGSTPAVNTGNIFSYLSESPGSSGVEDSDEHETNSEAEQESGEQERSAVVSTGLSTPPVQNEAQSFTTSRTSGASNIFGGLPKSSSQPAKGGLFGRVQMGSDNQPVRASPSLDDKQGSGEDVSAASVKPTAMPAKQPGDYTFNPATTPISFSQVSTGAAKTPVPAALGSSVKPMKSDTPEPKGSVSIFGLSSQTKSGPKPETPSLFGSSGPAKSKPSEAPISIFSSSNAAPATPSIFAAASNTSTGHSPLKRAEPPNPAQGTAAKKQAVSIFDKPAVATPATSETRSSDNVGDLSVPAAKNPTPNIFDQSFIAKNGARNKALSANMKAVPDFFSRSANPLFAGAKSNEDNSAVTKSTSDQFKEQEASVQNPKNEILQSANDGNKENSGSATGLKAVVSSTPAASVFGTQGGFKSAAPASTSLFGEQRPDNSAKAASTSLFGEQKSAISAKPAMTTLFGAQKSDSPAKPASASLFGEQKSDTPAKAAPPSLFGEQKSGNTAQPASTSLFGEQKSDTPVKAGPPSLFGEQKAEIAGKPASTSLFGAQKSDTQAKPAPTIFGGAPGANNSIFTFGSQSTSNTNSQSSSMTFGPGTTPGTTPGTSLLFGAPSSQPLGSDSNKIDFQFGGAGSGAGSSSFTFGQNSSVGSGFTFTAGTDKQPMNNPFAASQPSSQVSAPIFGGNSSTSTPSSSFNFTFGQQSSTLKAAPTPQANGLFGGASQANGTPSFSFSQPQPSQNVTSFMGNKAPGPMGIFGQLHAGGEASAGTASPFPAPSSMGTTPMNGTPEPEAGHEDGEEPRQTQISLTEGGPGEEDETIVHEVRAKAIKFIPVQPEDEDQDRKSPWSTQGVGSLRVLKNKQTGAVRMLLRAEPRGHVALNKTILSDVEYKAKDKTVNFVAAKDDGFGLETWVLQVKTAVFANELAKVLESNKISNKK